MDLAISSVRTAPMQGLASNRTPPFTAFDFSDPINFPKWDADVQVLGAFVPP